MKILILTHKPLYPLIDGGVVATNSIINLLNNTGIELYVLSIATYKHPANNKNIKYNFFYSNIYIDTKIKIFPLIKNLIYSFPYNIARFYNVNFKNKIIELLKKEKFDIIQLEGLYLSPYFNILKEYSTAKIIYRAHNVENILWQKRAKEIKNIFIKNYFKILSKQIRKLEEEIINKSDGVLFISKDDKNYFKSKEKLTNEIIYPALNSEDYKFIPPSANMTRKLFFIGSLDWTPNLNGLNWFIKNVWNKYFSDSSSLTFTIAGKSLKEYDIKNISNNIIIKGEIKESKEIFINNGILIVPLFSGSGIRIKIIEALFYGKVIICTKLAAEGIPYENKKNIIIANNAKEFADAINILQKNKEMFFTISKNARKLAEDEFNISKEREKILSFYKKILEK